MFSTTSCCTATRRLRDNIRLIEFDGLPIVFASIEIHLGLDLEHKISRISAKGLGPELILLHIYSCVCESKLFRDEILLTQKIEHSHRYLLREDIRGHRISLTEPKSLEVLNQRLEPLDQSYYLTDSWDYLPNSFLIYLTI